MVAPTADVLRQIIDAHFEWLAVHSEGRTFPLQKDEIEIEQTDAKLRIGMPSENGFRNWRVEDFLFEEGELVLNVSGNFGGELREVRFVPRTSAAELSANIELARLIRANEIAVLVEKNFAGTKIVRVALNEENGRLAQVMIETRPGVQTAVLADVTNHLPPEVLLSSAFLWLDRLNERRKKPVDGVWIVGETKQVRNLRKLHALLVGSEQAKVSIVEIAKRETEPVLRRHESFKRGSLWREKPKKLILPSEIEMSESAERIVEMAPEKIDVIRSKQGETLRFLGLPFARVRAMLGQERAWFGTGRRQRPLPSENGNEMVELIGELEKFRDPETQNVRHDFYRTSPEAWLESILRRNIKLLDANLILSPLYNQFRASSDKIDLLALRKDGRLVIIELKTSPDREMVFQAADYWRKIELQRRRGELAKARLFGETEIIDRPALVYAVAPALSFHRDFEYFARKLAPEIELWRFELHEDWRSEVKVIARKNYSGRF
jgi:hypothetical protein